MKHATLMLALPLAFLTFLAPQQMEREQADWRVRQIMGTQAVPQAEPAQPVPRAEIVEEPVAEDEPLALANVVQPLPVTAKDAPPDESLIRLPKTSPSSPPGPVKPTKLTAGVWYVIDADTPCLILTSPQGFVTTTTESGPIKLRGYFVDGVPGKVETRTYKGKWVTTLDPAQSGPCELLVIPAGADDPKQVIRRMLDVDVGPGPGPTPGPPTPPTPPVDPLQASLQRAYDADADADRATSLRFLQDVYVVMSQQAPVRSQMKTVGDVVAWERSIVQAPTVGLTASQLVSLRKAIAADMIAAFGTSATTPINLDKLAAELNKIASALKGIR